MTAEEIEAIDELINYSDDEYDYFWENCQCNDENKTYEDVKDCTCEENRHHIYRAFKTLIDLREKIAKAREPLNKKIKVIAQIVQCVACNGTGKQFEEELICINCLGSGEVKQ